MRSAFRIVESLCATTSVVRPLLRRSKASCIRISVTLSRADVASSRIRIRGFFRKTRAIAILCRYPQQNLDLRTLTMGISLHGCACEDMGQMCTKVYDHVTKVAEHLVPVAAEQNQYQI